MRMPHAPDCRLDRIYRHHHTSRKRWQGGNMECSVRSIIAVVCALLALPAVAAAQDAVTITGRVTSAEGGAPLGTASVTIEGLGTATLTRDDGRYSLVVPSARAHGQQATITARLIGYKAKSGIDHTRGKHHPGFRARRQSAAPRRNRRNGRRHYEHDREARNRSFYSRFQPHHQVARVQHRGSARGQDPGRCSE